MNALQRIKLLLQLQSALGKFQSAWNTFIKENTMLSFEQIIKSKTVWTNVIGFLVAGYGQISGTLPPQVTGVISAAVPLITLIWKIFSTKQVPTGSTSGN